MSGKEYTKIAIKEQEVKVGDKKFFIKTDTDQTVKFEKDDVEKGVEAKDKLKVKYAEKKEDGKKEWKDGTVVVKYDGGMWTEGIILDKKVEGMGEMQQEIKPGIGFFKAIRWPLYLVIGFTILAIIGLIWWWIASSNKEDKEEEGL